MTRLMVRVSPDCLHSLSTALTRFDLYIRESDACDFRFDNPFTMVSTSTIVSCYEFASWMAQQRKKQY